MLFIFIAMMTKVDKNGAIIDIYPQPFVRESLRKFMKGMFKYTC